MSEMWFVGLGVALPSFGRKYLDGHADVFGPVALRSELPPFEMANSPAPPGLIAYHHFRKAHRSSSARTTL